MPMHRGLLPREGFCGDVVLKLMGNTVFNPVFLLPLVLLSRYTKKGQDLSILHPTAARRLYFLLYYALARGVSSWFSDKVRNNWVRDKYDWSKEIVLITGGAAGIGASMVKLFEELGITVVVLDIQPLSYTASSGVHHYHCDIRSPTALAAVAEKIKAEVGSPTVIINNAGVATGKTILDSSPDDVRFTFDVNTLAHFWTIQTFLPDLISRNHGMVVTVSSYASWLTIPNMVDYGASKAATMALHEGLTAELATRYKAPKVRTVVVHPGATKTPLFVGFNQGSPFMMPTLEPESIAEAVVKQVLSGRSGQVVLPKAGGSLPTLRSFPDWYAYRLRNKAQTAMLNFSGRQVIEDTSASYEEL